MIQIFLTKFRDCWLLLPASFLFLFLHINLHLSIRLSHSTTAATYFRIFYNFSFRALHTAVSSSLHLSPPPPRINGRALCWDGKRWWWWRCGKYFTRDQTRTAASKQQHTQTFVSSWKGAICFASELFNLNDPNFLIYFSSPSSLAFSCNSIYKSCTRERRRTKGEFESTRKSHYFRHCRLSRLSPSHFAL